MSGEWPIIDKYLQCIPHLGEADEALSRGADEDLMQVGTSSKDKATVSGDSNYLDPSVRCS